MFSCEYWKIFKNTYFEEHLWTASSELQPDKLYVNPFHATALYLYPLGMCNYAITITRIT